MNHELAKTLTTALVQFIDRERSEGTMCCSSDECERLEKAFEVYNLDFVERFMEKKLSRLTDFEQALSSYLKNDFEYFHTKKWDEQKWNDVIRTQSKELLELAKKELFKQGEGTYYYLPNNNDLTYIDSMPMRMPYAMPEIHTLRPLCYEPGGTCTNPHFDCINCPKKTTGGIFTSPNVTTPCGTYTIGYEPVNTIKAKE